MSGLPEIPNRKGIPDAESDAGISFGGAALINKLFGNYRGIFNQYGVPLLLADNVLSLQYQNTSRVVSAPIEKDAFASDNKVADPFKATVQLSKGSGGAPEHGVTLIKVNVHQEEIREVTVKYDEEKVKNPDDAKKKCPLPII